MDWMFLLIFLLGTGSHAYADSSTPHHPTSRTITERSVMSALMVKAPSSIIASTSQVTSTFMRTDHSSTPQTQLNYTRNTHVLTSAPVMEDSIKITLISSAHRPSPTQPSSVRATDGVSQPKSSEPVQIIRFNRHLTMMPDNTTALTISCVATGIPTPTVTWVKFSDTNFTFSSVNMTIYNNTIYSTLLLHPITETSGGNYSCRATNLLGVKISTLIVRALRNLSRYQVTAITTKKSVAWANSLHVMNTTRSDSGLYACVAWNEVGNVISPLANLLILEPPDPVAIAVVNVTSFSIMVTWNVSFDGNSDITRYQVVILYDLYPNINIPIWSSLTEYTISDGKMRNYTVINLKPKNHYLIRLYATNAIGTSNASSVTAWTTAATISIVSIVPTQPVVEEGYDVTLTCICSGCITNLKYSWLKDNTSIPVDRAKYTFLPNGTLIIHSASQSDDGGYECTASQGKIYTASKPVYLSVWYFNQTEMVRNDVIYEGERLNLTCVANGKPRPTLQWHFEGIATETTTIVSHKPYEATSVLTLDAFSHNTGTYSCFGSNALRTLPLLSSHVLVKSFPILKISTTSTHVEQGESFSLNCSSDDPVGFSKISRLVWEKDGSIIGQVGAPYAQVDFGRLLVANATVKQSGKYRCQGHIGLASGRSSSVNVVVFIRSGPVVFEHKPETSTTGIKLSWKPIDQVYWNGQGVIYKVSVLYNDNVEVKVLTTENNNAIIAGLQSDTVYTITVSGYTVLGDVPPQSIKAQTKPNTNAKQHEISLRLTGLEFSRDLEDPSSRRFRKIKSNLEKSINDIYRQSAIRFQYIGSTVNGFRKGSVIADVVISMDTAFNKDPAVIVKEVNNVEKIGEYKFDKSFTFVTDFNECKERSFHSCHEYANCSNIVGSYICECWEGFFGDGENCNGPPQIVGRSPSNVTQLVETNVTLYCQVIGAPNPVISWQRETDNGEVSQVKKTSDKNEGDLFIGVAEIDDSGVYKCNASNTLGYQVYETRLKINPVIVDIDVEIKLSNKSFDKELENKTSEVYKKLEEEVYDGLYSFFNNTPDFDDIEILGFTNGSVNVEFRVILKVKRPSINPKDVVAVKVGRKLNKQIKSGRIGKIRVDPKQIIQIKEAPPRPENVTYSDILVTSLHVYWDHPPLHEMFSIQNYSVNYRKYGEELWNNASISVEQLTNIALKNLQSNSFYSVNIVAENAFGNSKKSQTLNVKTLKLEVIPLWYYIAPIIALFTIVVLLVLFFVLRHVSRSRNWKLFKERHSKKNQTDVESFQMKQEKHNLENVYENDLCTEPDDVNSWTEIQKSSLELLENAVEQGEFGAVVVAGRVKRAAEAEYTPCSVKMSRDPASEIIARDLTQELYGISAIQPHKNIVNIIGACTIGLDSPLIVLEFCSNGTLFHHLKQANLKSTTSGLSAQEKIKLAREVAEGMIHLAGQKVVHRNLATRNVLLTDDFTAKISNFRLSRDIYETGTYEKSAGGKMPARWMALESLLDGVYTSRSDVWSFGVLMWEIETKACIPYEEYEVITLVEKVRSGYRLPQPEQTSNEVYHLMRSCWEVNPLERPSFEAIASTLEEFLVKKPFVNIPLEN